MVSLKLFKGTNHTKMASLLNGMMFFFSGNADTSLACQPVKFLWDDLPTWHYDRRAWLFFKSACKVFQEKQRRESGSGFLTIANSDEVDGRFRSYFWSKVWLITQIS